MFFFLKIAKAYFFIFIYNTFLAHPCYLIVNIDPNFLYQKGIDTNGHAKKPDSKEYLENIGVVDKGISKAYQQFEDFFNHDGRTAYILTSDHGMAPWGAHGSGLQSETETPFVAWGSGIKKPTKHRNINKDTQSIVWELEDWERTDIQQIDLADLMSFLIGLFLSFRDILFTF